MSANRHGAGRVRGIHITHGQWRQRLSKLLLALCMAMLVDGGSILAESSAPGQTALREQPDPSNPASSSQEAQPPAGQVTGDLLAYQARMVFGALPEKMPGAEHDTPQMVALGRKLYFEPGMSVNKTQSCNACHKITRIGGGADHTKTSRGAKKAFGPRNSPTVLNAGFQIAQFWDGRAADLKEQARGPVLNPIEMGNAGPGAVMERLRTMGYKTRFEQAYPGEAQPFRFENVSRAIAAYERTLRSTGRFDRFMQGDLQALSGQEQEGLKTFMRQGCQQCHNGATMGGLMYQKMGIYHPYRNREDTGRFEVTRDPSDRYVFKVPMLRNVTLTAPYFHDGQVDTLPEAIDQMGWLQLNRQLDNREIVLIMRFLTSLADEAQTSAPTPPAASEGDAWWQPQNPDQLPGGQEAESIRYGARLLTNTYHHLGQGAADVALIKTGNAMDCVNCHQDRGTKAYGIPWVGVTQRYPRHRGRADAVRDLKDRINGCMQRSMNGRSLDKDSREMKAMIAYMSWLSDGAPPKIAFQGTPKLTYPDRAADPQKGEILYMTACQTCHGTQGTGYQSLSAGRVGSYVAPALWGDGAYNDGAGMHRVLTAARFIKSNMPLGTPWQRPMLTDDEAYDLAAYINSQPRPHMQGLRKDYPNLVKKPIDAPYRPYADDFPAEQHKFGPFGPIAAYYEALGDVRVSNPNR